MTMAPRFRLAPDEAAPVTAAADRTAHYLFSDESVARDGCVILNSAWQLDSYLKNPVFCWQHDTDLPPIGRVFNLRVAQDGLRGSVRYAETDFAETIYQLVRGRFLQAVSVSWLPLQQKPMTDGSYGVIFTECDLLEISQCCVGCNPGALLTAGRSINMKSLATWAERALDTGRLASSMRPQLEAICRAARGAPRRTSTMRHTTDDDTFAARGHLTRAQTHHRSVTGHHERTSEHLRDLREAIDRTSSTLASLGIHDHEATRAVSALERCHRDLRSSHDAASDAHHLTGDALEAVASCLAGTGAGPTTGTDPQAETSEERARADRARRARELLAKGEADEQADRARRALELVAKGCP
jgi:HK97 family phage prohead protease